MNKLNRVALAICPNDCPAPCEACRRAAARAGEAYAAILQEQYGGSSLTAECISAIASMSHTTSDNHG